ncbi:hypothetical protein Cantr_03655 [Candida viswanathii]|uniref:Uncharacterized protein n=1 Tax=Candida viswanathii TaxID=5486 RepID=A0A367XN67_9ASCO|nr:hypothetical protein Cantr_03655 [Candida viswanathii]
MPINNQPISRAKPAAYTPWLGVGAILLAGGAYMLYNRTPRHEPGCNCRECFRRSSYKNWGPRQRPENDIIKE